MNDKDLIETQSTGIQACEITLENGQKKQFDSRFLLFVLESTKPEKDKELGSVLAVKKVSDNELLNLIESLLGTILKNGYPKLMVLNWLLNMLNGDEQ